MSSRTNEPAHLLGRILMADGLVTEAQLQQALAFQAEHAFLRLGEILLGRGHIGFEQLVQALDMQHRALRLGQILVRGGHVTPEQLDTALRHQSETAAMLGHVLVQLGFCSQERVQQALDYQRWYDEFAARNRQRSRTPRPPALDPTVHHRWVSAPGFDTP